MHLDGHDRCLSAEDRITRRVAMLTTMLCAILLMMGLTGGASWLSRARQFEQRRTKLETLQAEQRAIYIGPFQLNSTTRLPYRHPAPPICV